LVNVQDYCLFDSIASSWHDLGVATTVVCIYGADEIYMFLMVLSILYLSIDLFGMTLHKNHALVYVLCNSENWFPFHICDYTVNFHFSLNNYLFELNDFLVQMMVSKLLDPVDMSWTRS
jgi:hypothetical protein